MLVHVLVVSCAFFLIFCFALFLLCMIFIIHIMLCTVGWEWHDWDKLPNNLFPPLLKLKESGYNPFHNTHDCSFGCIDMNC